MTTSLSIERQKAFDNFYAGAMKKDAQQMRAVLTDDFAFRGPMTSFDNPDAFIDSLLAVDADVTASRLIVDGGRVAHLFVLDVAAPIRAKVPMCDVLQFDGNRICAIELYTDPSLFMSKNDETGPDLTALIS